jgi:N-acetylglucosaminylphosphatidylinositol deacetylase
MDTEVYWQVLWITLLVLPFALYLKAIWSAVTTPYLQRKIENRSILYVIAHPDDEAMFFVPSILSLRNTGNKLHLLCLSTGNFGGQGKVREKELHASAK